MSSGLTLQNLTLILRGLDYYRKSLFADIEKLNQQQDEIDDNLGEDEYDEAFDKLEIQIGKLVKESDGVANTLRCAEEVYASKHEKVYGEPPIPVRG